MKAASGCWWIAGLAAAALAAPAWAQTSQWVCGELFPGCSTDWADTRNWIQLPLETPQRVPKTFDDVRVTRGTGFNGSSTANYVDTRPDPVTNSTPLFRSLLVEGVELRHSRAIDGLNTLSLTIGAGGKYLFDATGGGVSVGALGDPLIVGAASGSASFDHLGSGTVVVQRTTPTPGSNPPSDLILGQAFGADGTYRMNGEAWLIVAGGSTIVGQGGTGVFEQTTSTHNTSRLVLGEQGSGTGTYFLTDGINVGWLEVAGSTIVGQAGAGTFNQTGGVHNAASLVLGAESTGSGTYGLGSSAISIGVLNVAGSTVIGQSGSGTFTNAGGSHNTDSLVLGEKGAGVGTYTLKDGLTTGSLAVKGNIVVGQSGSGTLNVESGGLYSAAMTVNANGTLNYSGGDFLLADGTGTLTVAAGGHVYVSGGGWLTLDGKVDNAGLFKVTGTTIRYTGEFNNTGTYISDPSYNIFDADLVVTGNGYLVGGLGDIFQVGGSFRNSSSNAAQWDTDLASLIFFGAGTHEFGVAGDSPEAFEWGDIRAGDDVFLRFFDSSAVAGMVLRVGALDLAEQIAGIIVPVGQFLTIYFDQARQENAYLLAALNSGQLPTGLRLIGYGAPPNNAPEPSTLALMAAGLGLLLRRDRRRGGRVQVA